MAQAQNVKLSRKNNRAFTLVEMLVALVIILISIMALMKTSIVVMRNNLRNEIRNKAIEVLSNHVDALTGSKYISIVSDNISVTKPIRNFQETFNITDNVIDNNSSKYINSTVNWDYSGKSYSYKIETVVSKK